MAGTFKNILVPADFSPTSRGALEYARRLARENDASLLLLHVIEDPFNAAAWTEGYALSVDVLRDRMVEDARAELTQLVTSMSDCKVTSNALVGHPGRTIVEFAAECHADLIVMGTHGRSGISHLLLGSVAERVVRLAPCPVLTVRALPEDVPDARSALPERAAAPATVASL